VAMVRRFALGYLRARGERSPHLITGISIAAAMALIMSGISTISRCHPITSKPAAAASEARRRMRLSAAGDTWGSWSNNSITSAPRLTQRGERDTAAIDTARHTSILAGE